MASPTPNAKSRYLTLYEELKQSILAGQLSEGERLPSSRSMADARGLSRTTVTSAYDQLLSEGYIVSRRGSGCYVASPLPGVDFPAALTPRAHRSGPAPALSTWGEALRRQRPLKTISPSAAIDFQYGNVDLDEKSQHIWIKSARHWAYRQSRHYGDTLGLPALREAISAYLQLNRACRSHPDRVVITSGGQQGFDLITRLAINPGDRVAVENPGYPRVKQLLTALGANLIPIAVDEEGLKVEDLPQGSRAPKLVYVTPSHQFPSGCVMSLRRRLALLEWAQANDAWIIEDDYDSEFRYCGKPIESLQGLDHHERVIYAGTFSKVLFPALKLGYLLLPESWLEPFAFAKQIADRHSPWLEQHILAEFMQTGEFERHLRRMRKRYAMRQQTLATALQPREGDVEILVEGDNAGLHLVCWMPSLPLSAVSTFIEQVQTQGVRVYPIHPFYHGEPPAAGLLLGFATLTPAEITQGVRIIKRTLREF
ncbi:PLP-dependent aminotransferase family protein [Hahella chejuensis]|nr:PLP-dependent aminotransferase family protein [Hahella chejuensis]